MIFQVLNGEHDYSLPRGDCESNPQSISHYEGVPIATIEDKR